MSHLGQFLDRIGRETTRLRRADPRRFYTWLAMAAVVSLGGCQAAAGRLQTPVAPLGIVSFELAHSLRRAQSILTVWDTFEDPGRTKRGDMHKAAAANVRIDNAFIPAYAALLILWCAWATDALVAEAKRRKQWHVRWGRGGVWLLAILVVVAAGVNYAENGSLLAQLNGGPNAASAAAAYWYAAAKFTIIGFCLAYVAVAFCLSSSYTAFRSSVSEIVTVLVLIRFSLAISILCGIALLIPDQSLEALRVLAEDHVAAATAREATVANWRLTLFASSALLLSTISWYCARVVLYICRPGELSTRGWRHEATKYSPRICALVPLLACAWALQRAALPLPDPSAPEQATPAVISPAAQFLHVLAWSFLALTGLYALFLWNRRALIDRFFPSLNQQTGLDCWLAELRTNNPDIPPSAPTRRSLSLGLSTRVALGLSLIPFGIAVLVIWCGLSGGAQRATSVGPVAVLLFALASIIPIGTYIQYLSTLTRVPILMLLLIAATVFSYYDINDNHQIRLSRSPKPHGTVSEAETFDTTFTEWLRHRPDRPLYHGRPYPVVLVAAEGGGLRAAYQAAIALAELQDASPVFAQHTFAISGVSGGSVGAATFVALATTARPPTQQRAGTAHPSTDKWAVQTEGILSRDLLSAPLASLLFAESLQRFLPSPIPKFDRARSLEISLEQGWDALFPGGRVANPFRTPIYDLSHDFARRSVPALFLNTTRVETGDRMVMSTIPTERCHMNGLVSLADVNPQVNPSLSTAACLSARFTYITPTGSVPIYDAAGVSTGKKRYADGGYYENSGAATLTDLLEAIHEGDGRADPKHRRPEYCFVVLRIGFTYRPEEPAAAPKRVTSFDEPLAPLVTLYNTRDARGRTAVARLESAVMALPPDRRSRFIDFEFKQTSVPLALGWLLSKQARDDLGNQAKRMTCSIDGTTETCLQAVLEALRPPAPPKRSLPAPAAAGAP